MGKTIAAMLLLLLLAGCAVGSMPEAPAPSPNPEAAALDPAETQSGDAEAAFLEEADRELLRDLTKRMERSFNSPEDPDTIGAFVRENDRFTLIPTQDMLLFYGLDSDVYRYDRFRRFFENHSAGIADELIVVYSAEPLVCCVEILSTDGKTLTARAPAGSSGSGLPERPTRMILEADGGVWRLKSDGLSIERMLSYAKYGVVPVPLGEEPHPASREEAWQALRGWISNAGYLQELVGSEPEPSRWGSDETLVCGQECYQFILQPSEDASPYARVSFCVAKDLRFFCRLDKVNGNYLMELAAADSPEAFAAVELPKGAIVNGGDPDMAEIFRRVSSDAAGGNPPEEGLEWFLTKQESYTCYPDYGWLYQYELSSGVFRLDRINRFVENYKAGKPDRLGILRTGEPMPLFITRLETDGKELWVDGGLCDLRENGTEWIVQYRESQTEIVGLAKFGLVPTLIAGAPRPATREQAKEAVLAWVEESGWALQNPDFYGGTLWEQADKTVAGETCYVFNSQTGSVFLVNQDLSCFYWVEQVNGQYVLELSPAASPEAYAGAKLPQGPIRRIDE